MTRPSYLRRCPECQATQPPHAPDCTRDASRPKPKPCKGCTGKSVAHAADCEAWRTKPAPKKTSQAKDSAPKPRTPSPAPFAPSLVSGASWVVVTRGEPSEYEKACQGPINDAEQAYLLVRDRILREQVEVMYCLALDASYRVTHLAEISRGGTGMCAMQVKDILRLGVATGATDLVIVHNHPSGDASPSNQDLKLTQAVITGCEAVGLRLLDHVVVGRWTGKDSFTSILQALRDVAHKKCYEPDPPVLLSILEAVLSGRLATETSR